MNEMIETEVCGTVISGYREREESGDEELTVLPRHTKVIVTGNNRTKSVLVGLQGVVKKAVGLGGWHWLVLKNGIEVKLQRNALSVLEPPTGNEEDDEFDHSSSSSDVIDKEPDFPRSMEFHKVSKPRVRHTRPWAQSALVKSNNRCYFKDFEYNIHAPHSRLNFSKLGSDSLWRYLTRFHLGNMNSSSPSKEHLVNIVQHHFASQWQQVVEDEVQVIADFVRAAKKLRTNYDTNSK